MLQALIPIFVLIVLLVVNVYLLGNDAISGANQIALLLAAAVAGIISMRLGYKWEDIEHSIVKSISAAMAAILILLIIGSLSGTWMLSGIVPAQKFGFIAPGPVGIGEHSPGHRNSHILIRGRNIEEYTGGRS